MKAMRQNELFNTSDFGVVLKLCETACCHHMMVGLIGDTGTGKTASTKAFVLKRNGIRIVYEKSMDPRIFFSSLLKLMNVDFEGRVYSEVDTSIDILSRIDNSLLIINEPGIVLAGMPYFKSNLQEFANRGKEGCCEFLRRINIWHELEGLNTKEVKAVSEANGIDDPERLSELSRKRRFGELMNEIMLNKVITEEM